MLGHWRYTQATWEWFRTWRTRMAAEDRAVRKAVDERDAAFVALGEVTRSLAETTPADPELQAFAATLSRFEREAGSLGARQQELLAAADRARADVDAAMSGYDARLATLRQESAPLEMALRAVSERLESLKRQAIALAARNTRARDASIATDLERNELTRLELEVERARLEAAVAASRRQADALTEEQRQMGIAGEREIIELRGRAERASTEGGQVAERRLATLQDLGHEALRRALTAEPLVAPREVARGALERLEAVRARREQVLAERREIDLAPCVRTLAAAGMLMVGLILLVLFV